MLDPTTFAILLWLGIAIVIAPVVPEAICQLIEVAVRWRNKRTTKGPPNDDQR